MDRSSTRKVTETGWSHLKLSPLITVTTSDRAAKKSEFRLEFREQRKVVTGMEGKEEKEGIVQGCA